MVLPSLLDKLNFIRRFYEITSDAFVDTKRKIEQHEEPFHHFNIDDEEPPFLAEWLDADESLNILGKSCLCLLQNAFFNYLRGFIDSYAPVNAVVTLNTVGGDSAFEKHRRVFLQAYNIDWAASPVDVHFLEEINFARNDIQHGGTFYDMEHRQNPQYFNRFPASIFADQWERELFANDGGMRQPRITVTRDSLFAAIEAIEDFCSYLDAEWWKIFQENRGAA
jgi:hypothetical protein